MADELLSTEAGNIEKLSLIPSEGGVFKIWFNGQLVFNKQETARHPRDREMLEQLRNH